MDKILVNIYVPIFTMSYDMLIPPASPMHEVMGLIKKAVTEMSDGQFISGSNNVICFRDSGKIIDINLLVFETGIHNGSRLMLI